MILVLMGNPLYRDSVSHLGRTAKAGIAVRVGNRLFPSLSHNRPSFLWVFVKACPSQRSPHPFHVPRLMHPLLRSLSIHQELLQNQALKYRPFISLVLQL